LQSNVHVKREMVGVDYNLPVSFHSLSPFVQPLFAFTFSTQNSPGSLSVYSRNRQRKGAKILRRFHLWIPLQLRLLASDLVPWSDQALGMPGRMALKTP